LLASAARIAAARASVSRARAAAVSATHAPTAVASNTGVSSACATARRRPGRAAVEPSPAGGVNPEADGDSPEAGGVNPEASGVNPDTGDVKPETGEPSRADAPASPEVTDPIRLSGSPGAGDGRDESETAAEAAAAASGIAVTAAYSDGDGGAAEAPAGGQVSWAGDAFGLASASVRGRCAPVCRPPPAGRAPSIGSGDGAPIARIRSGTWLGSTT
jgi:hypothetical protein